MLPALSCLRAKTSNMKGCLEECVKQLVKARIQTGRHDYIGFGRVRDVKGVDLVTTSSDVCNAAMSVSTYALSLQMSMKLADFIIVECGTVRTSNQSSTDAPGSRPGLNSAQEQTASLARYWKLHADCIFNKAQSLQWRSEIMLQTVYTLSSQRDQDVSIQIARDSKTLAEQAKGDSSSMKAIAAVSKSRHIRCDILLYADDSVIPCSIVHLF